MNDIKDVYLKIDGKEYLEKDKNGGYMLLLGKYALYLGYTPIKITITPKEAEEILKKYNKSNRPLSTERVKKLENAIIENKFEFNGDTIKFCDGYLVDGQHRLKACMIAQKEITVLVCLIPKNAIKTIDTYTARTSKDILILRGFSNKDASILASAILFHSAFIFQDSLVRTNIIKSEYYDYLEKYPEILYSYNRLKESCFRFKDGPSAGIPNSIIPSGVYIIFLMKVKKEKEQEAIEYLKKIRFADGLNKGTIFYTIRLLLEKKALARNEGLNFSNCKISISNALGWKILSNGWNLIQQGKKKCTEEQLLAGDINRVPLL